MERLVRARTSSGLARMSAWVAARASSLRPDWSRARIQLQGSAEGGDGLVEVAGGEGVQPLVERGVGLGGVGSCGWG
jgi:hypothetical protein